MIQIMPQGYLLWAACMAGPVEAYEDKSVDEIREKVQTSLVIGWVVEDSDGRTEVREVMTTGYNAADRWIDYVFAATEAEAVELAIQKQASHNDRVRNNKVRTS